MDDLNPQEIRARARELEDQGMGGRSQRMRQMVAYWKEFCPRMYKHLRTNKVLWEYATILQDQRNNRCIDLMSMGIGPDDASRQANEILLMTPEPESDPEAIESPEDD